ncbi:hypothetical protein G9P44_002234 [Scheffersomyces stipitis]|nr:hypothetical protein G9P44_002234 [Scheffersomyces stipitis]
MLNQIIRSLEKAEETGTMSWWSLVTIIACNVRDDVVANLNLSEKLPVMLFLYPETFEPPFTNGFNEFFNVSSVDMITSKYDSNTVLANCLVMLFGYVLAVLDIAYSALRLLVAGMMVGATLGLSLFFLFWVNVTFTRRWKFVLMYFQNLESCGLW